MMRPCQLMRMWQLWRPQIRSPQRPVQCRRPNSSTHCFPMHRPRRKCAANRCPISRRPPPSHWWSNSKWTATKRTATSTFASMATVCPTHFRPAPNICWAHFVRATMSSSRMAVHRQHQLWTITTPSPQWMHIIIGAKWMVRRVINHRIIVNRICIRAPIIISTIKSAVRPIHQRWPAQRIVWTIYCRRHHQTPRHGVYVIKVPRRRLIAAVAAPPHCIVAINRLLSLIIVFYAS